MGKMITEKRELTYDCTVGYLFGETPNQIEVMVGHEKSDRTGYVLFWEGRRYKRFGQAALEEVFGIAPREKKSGSQKGYPSEPAIRAVWRHFVDRYKNGDSKVKFRKMKPRLS